MVLLYNYFSTSGEQPEQRMFAHKSEQPAVCCIGIFYKNAVLQNIWVLQNIESMKSLGVCYRYVIMPRCVCVWHGLEYFTFYVQKRIARLVVCSASPLVRDWPLGTLAIDTRLLKHEQHSFKTHSSTWRNLQPCKRINWNELRVYRNCNIRVLLN